MMVTALLGILAAVAAPFASYLLVRLSDQSPITEEERLEHGKKRDDGMAWSWMRCFLLLFVQFMHWMGLGAVLRCLKEGHHRALLEFADLRSALPALVVPVLLVPLLGHLSDVLGRKTLIILATMEGTVRFAALGLWGISETGVLAVVASLGLLSNVFAVNGAVCAAFCDLTVAASETTRLRLLSLAQMPVWLGISAGCVFSDVLSVLMERQRSFAIIAAVDFGLLILLVILLCETLPPERREFFNWHKANPFGVLRLFRAERRSTVLTIGLICADLGLFSGVATWPGFSKAMDWPELKIGTEQDVFYFVNTIGLLLLPQISFVLGPRRLILLSVTCAALMWLLQGVVSATWQVFVLMVIGMPSAMIYPPACAILASDFGWKNFGLAMGVPSLVHQLSNLSAASSSHALWRWREATGQAEGSAFIVPALLYITATGVLSLLPAKTFLHERNDVSD